MRIRLIIALFVVSAAAHASDTLRVGGHVLTTGDSQERVVELLGKPSSKSHRSRSHRGSRRRGGLQVIDNNQGGERWRYHRNGHVTVVIIIDGRVAEIDDRRL